MATLLHQVTFHGVVRPTRKAWAIAIRLLTALLRRVSTSHEAFLAVARRRFPELDQVIPEPTRDELIRLYYRSLPARLTGWTYQPKISILVPVYKVSPGILRETLASVAAQVYSNWELCIVDDASANPQLTSVIDHFTVAHPGKVRSAIHPQNAHISVTSNSCLALANGDYVALLDHDDLLLPNALAEMVRYINLRDQPDILYSDERVIDERGGLRHGPFHKPAWSPLLHLSCNYTTHLSVYRRDLLNRLGGFRPGYEGSQDHDLMLRAVEASSKPVVHVPFVLYQWRAMPGSTAASIDEKPYAAVNGIKAVTEACARRGTPAEVTWERQTFHYRVAFALPSPPPLISIIIPTRDRPELLGPCVDSIIKQTTWSAYEIIIVDNGTQDQKALALLQSLQDHHPGAVKVIRDSEPFNYGRLNNLGVAASRGSYLLFLNNDTEVITPEWLEEMLRVAALPSVGAVGCKLLYPDQTIQHAGIVLADRKVAIHALRTLPSGDHTYISMANTMHEVSAVTAACMLVARRHFDDVGGFDDRALSVGFGDIDFCLKLRRTGLSNVFTPYAKLLHRESRSRGRAIENFEKLVMIERWGHELMNDPYLNFNLARSEHYPLGVEGHLDASSELLSEVFAGARAVTNTEGR